MAPSRHARAVAHDHAAVLDHRPDRGDAHAHQVEQPRRAQHHEVGALARLQAAHLVVHVQRVGAR